MKGILLIDSPSPIDHVPLSDSLIESVVNLDARSAASELAKLVKTQFAMNARMLGRYNPHSSGGTCPPLVMLRSSEGYNPPGVLDVPVWLSNRHDVGLATTGWDTLSSKPIEVFDIPGHHFQPFHPSNVRMIMSINLETVSNQFLTDKRCFAAHNRRLRAFGKPIDLFTATLIT